MEFEQLEKIATPEQKGYAQVWTDIQNRASRRFNLDVINAFSDRAAEAYRIKGIAQSINMGKYITPLIGTPIQTTPNSYPNYFGHSIELNNPGDTCVCSNMQTIYIQEINFYFNGTPGCGGGSGGSPDEVGLYIIDADFGTTLYEITIPCTQLVQGWNNVNVELEFTESRRILVVMNGTMSNFVFQDIGNFNLQGFNQTWNYGSAAFNGYGLWFGWGACGCQSQVQGVTWNGTTETFGTNIFGVSAVFRINCSYSGLVCQNKKHFADAWLHCLALEVLDQRIYSNRLNSWTTINVKRAQELKVQLNAQYLGGTVTSEQGSVMYQGALEKAVKYIYLDTSDCCITADSMYQLTETRF